MTKPDTSPLRARLVVAATAAALLLSACTGAPSQPADPAQTPAQTQAESPGAATSTPTNAQGDAARASATPEALAVVQARETSTSRGPVTVGVNSLVVRGDVMTLNFSVTNTGTDEWMPWTDFNDGPGRDLNRSVDGVYVVDATNGKRHLPARDGDDDCVCSVPGNQRVKPGHTVTYSAVYRAVPAGVDTVSVFIPSAGVFDDIPVTR